MLPNTTIVPDIDAKLGASLIEGAVEALDVILMLVFGKDDLARLTVEWADQLANRMPADSGTVRPVQWIRFPARDQTPRSVGVNPLAFGDFFRSSVAGIPGGI